MSASALHAPGCAQCDDIRRQLDLKTALLRSEQTTGDRLLVENYEVKKEAAQLARAAAKVDIGHVPESWWRNVAITFGALAALLLAVNLFQASRLAESEAARTHCEGRP